MLYYDVHACPPLAQERKAREKAGLPLTRIAGNGYYEPLRVIPIVPQPALAAAGAGPALAVATPAGVGEAAAAAPTVASSENGVLRWIYEEAKFHLLPWRAGRHDMVRAIGMGLAVVVTIVWLLSGAGRVGPAAVIAWWIGWSVYELASRVVNLPWIKDGRWWKRDFRPGTVADLAAYVATKNLLIGAVLFAVLHSAGVLHLLARLEALQWLH